MKMHEQLLSVVIVAENIPMSSKMQGAPVSARWQKPQSHKVLGQSLKLSVHHMQCGTYQAPGHHTFRTHAWHAQHIVPLYSSISLAT